MCKEENVNEEHGIILKSWKWPEGTEREILSKITEFRVGTVKSRCDLVS